MSEISDTTEDEADAGEDAALPVRGSFPKGPPGETAERRARYEAWVLGTRGTRPDFEARSVRVLHERGSGSLALCTASRCRQCVGSEDDTGARARVAECADTTCGLWPVRPFQEVRQAGASRRTAVRVYCSECAGRVPGGSWTQVEECAAVTCAVWPVRPGNWRVGEVERGTGSQGGAA